MMSSSSRMGGRVEMFSYRKARRIVSNEYKHSCLLHATETGEKHQPGGLRGSYANFTMIHVIFGNYYF